MSLVLLSAFIAFFNICGVIVHILDTLIIYIYVFLLQIQYVNAREHAWTKHVSVESPAFLVAASVTLGVHAKM